MSETTHGEINIASSHDSTLTITGVPSDISAEKIHKILDLLELPKGTKVTVNKKASSVIVR